MLRKKINISDVSLYFIPIKTRVPLKFGSEVVDRVTCARVSITLKDGQGRVSIGWGETPLSVTWVWPGALSYDEREEHLKEFCRKAALSWKELIERNFLQIAECCFP